MNVVLITIDSLRADHLGCYGFHKNITPNIDQLAKEASIFSQAIANGPNTFCSIPSVLASVFPSKQNIISYGDNLNLAEVLNKNGFYTCGVHSNPWFIRFGFGNSFGYFKDPFEKRVRRREKGISVLKRFLDPSPLVYRTISHIYKSYKSVAPDKEPYANADKINREAISFLSEGLTPFFLWVHYMDTHEPHFPQKNFYDGNIKDKEIQRITDKYKHEQQKLTSEERDTIMRIYDSEVEYVDKKVGELISQVDKLNGIENTIIVVTADHGEELGDHNHFGHGGGPSDRPLKLYDELLNVPLIIIGGPVPGGIYRNQVELMDLSPTILELLGIEKPKSFVGENLFKVDYRKEYVISRAFQCEKPNEPEFLKSGVPVISYRTGQYKLIYNAKSQKVELYELNSDPQEKQNISDRRQKITEQLAKKMFMTLHHKNHASEVNKIKRKVKILFRRRNM